MPALLTRTSQAPTRRPRSSHDLGSETSRQTNSPLISPATCLPSFSFKSQTKTLAPACAKTRAIASPMPEAAPVTTAILSVNLNIQPLDISAAIPPIILPDGKREWVNAQCHGDHALQ